MKKERTTLSEIHNLPPDAEIIVTHTYKYKPHEVTQQLFDFWIRNAAIIENKLNDSNDKETEYAIH